MADIEGLKKFVRKKGGNRGRAEFFVGRKEELALIENACIQAVERKASSDPGEMDDEPGVILFTGAPGMGKSALLAEGRVLAQGVSGNGQEDETTGPPRIVKAIRKHLKLASFGTPLVIKTEPGQLETEASLLDLCAKEARRLRDEAGAKHLSRGIGILTDLFTMADPERALGELDKINVLQRPLVVLMIDEAQSSNEDNAKLYRRLHLGLHQLPIVPVLGGLSDSRPALRRAGISRFARGYSVELKMLDDGDCKEAMEAFLDRYEIDVPQDGRREWLNLAVEHSDRFPHHLNTVLLATAEVVIQQGGELNSGMLAEAGQEIKKWKDDYYAKQAVGFRPAERKVAAQIVMEATQHGKDPIDLAGELLPNITHPRKDVHGDIDATGFVQRMEHSGMLWCVDDEDRYECPIPSFHAWLQRKYGKRDTERSPGQDQGRE